LTDEATVWAAEFNSETIFFNIGYFLSVCNGLDETLATRQICQPLKGFSFLDPGNRLKSFVHYRGLRRFRDNSETSLRLSKGDALGFQLRQD